MSWCVSVTKIGNASLQQLGLSRQSGAQRLKSGNLNTRWQLDIANALVERIPIVAVVIWEMKRRSEQAMQLLMRTRCANINPQSVWNVLEHRSGLT
jgi:hypothetical protein